MRKLLLLSLILALGLAGYSQKKAVVSKKLRYQNFIKAKPTEGTMNFSKEVLPASKAVWPPAEDLVGTTYYDLQSNSSCQTRIAEFSDGTIGATFTYGVEYAAFSLIVEQGTIIMMVTTGVRLQPNVLKVSAQVGQHMLL